MWSPIRDPSFHPYFSITGPKAAVLSIIPPNRLFFTRFLARGTYLFPYIPY
ncbi:hypothetical protein CLOSTASPAR_05746 [[Clostridium] asparagiforme DSM 15981]|uniref:Uncharacterized protein n=1 Tax=[Clostridium] asparagiforme DSM 15981 TaxID=518636 RepID=C0D8Z6_9FIRM|nr:hypothetical protein CLOSTASPAR_05746 [[Clostridium] asparagiforme DSM 15981]